jgi:2-polyprenyl-6-methoxyphenol hydroxylase-like FAD-dependent oxidoreductase
MKTKRKKPFSANRASFNALEKDGWTVGVVEQRIPHCFITRDLFGFADLIAVSPARGIMAVQVTGGASTSNFHARVAKTKAEPRHAIWLASGGRIQVHSWEGKGKTRELRVLEITATETL